MIDSAPMARIKVEKFHKYLDDPVVWIKSVERHLRGANIASWADVLLSNIIEADTVDKLDKIPLHRSGLHNEVHR